MQDLAQSGTASALSWQGTSGVQVSSGGGVVVTDCSLVLVVGGGSSVVPSPVVDVRVSSGVDVRVSSGVEVVEISVGVVSGGSDVAVATQAHTELPAAITLFSSLKGQPARTQLRAVWTMALDDSGVQRPIGQHLSPVCCRQGGPTCKISCNSTSYGRPGRGDAGELGCISGVPAVPYT
jgi:hypothetical protein